MSLFRYTPPCTTGNHATAPGLSSGNYIGALVSLIAGILIINRCSRDHGKFSLEMIIRFPVVMLFL